MNLDVLDDRRTRPGDDVRNVGLDLAQEDTRHGGEQDP
jgi:hypothetical protein